jgi:hypothetical protein
LDEAHLLDTPDIPLECLLAELTDVNYRFWQAEHTSKGYGLA